MASFVAPIVSGLGSLFGGLFGQLSAVQAAQIQADAATRAAQMQQQEFGQALGFQENVYGNEQQNLNPYITAGQGNLANLEGILPSLTTPYQSFQAPTGVDMSNDPGYQFRLQQGENALTNSAAARGGLLSGGTAEAMQNYVQGEASNEYSNVYNRALQTYGTNQGNYYTGQGNQFNRLSSLAGMGQSAAGMLGSEGTAAGQIIGNTLGQLGNSQATGINNAAAASASGIIGGSNALTGGIQGAANDASGLLNLNAIMQASRGSGYGPGAAPGYSGFNDPNNPMNYGQGNYAQPMAKGGPVAADHPFIVGENGPELFIPHRDGMIMPHSRLQAIRNLARAA